MDFIQAGAEMSISFIEPGELKNNLEHILDLAKWTSSGDNCQPWRFEIRNEREVVVHIHNEGSIFDYAGKPSLLTIGFFLESFIIAAAHFSCGVQWVYEENGHKNHRVIFRIEKDDNIKDNSLVPFLKIRSVNRFPYKLKNLTQKQKSILEDVLGSQLKITWLESLPDRMAMARINALTTFIRLSIKEAYTMHKAIIDFDHDFSPDKIPIKAVGLFPLTQKLIKFELKSWERADWMNRFLGAAIILQLEMDFIPGLFCGAHYLVQWENPDDANNVNACLLAGQSLQRFWLTVTQMGLVMQPSVGCLALAYYGNNQIDFTENIMMQKRSVILAKRLNQIAPVNNIVFMGRMGFPYSKLLKSRSIRKSLSELKYS